MRFVSEADAERLKVNTDCGNISRTGSVRGMQEKYGWPRFGQVRIGGYIYNVGPAEVERLRAAGALRGER